MRYSELFEQKQFPQTPKELILYLQDRLQGAGQNTAQKDKECQLMYGNRQLEADLAEIEREETSLEYEKLQSDVEQLIQQAETDAEAKRQIKKLAQKQLKSIHSR
jgi:hypothetical protein